MAKKVLVAKGVSSTGTIHQLEIEPVPTEIEGTLPPYVAYKFTVLGPTGKRHASVILTPKDKKKIQEFLRDN